MQHPLDMPLVRLRRPRKTAFRTRVIVAACVVLIAAAATVTWNAKHDSVLPVSSKWAVKRLPELGIQFSYPANWHLQNINEMSGHARARGVLISNLDHGFEHPEGTGLYDMRGLDEALVVVWFHQVELFTPPTEETFGLPLTLDAGQMVTDSESYGGPQPRYLFHFGVANHRRSNLHLYIGEVSDMQRAAVEMILSSVRPLP